MSELREGQRLPLTAEPRTASGNPAVYQTGTAVWESSDPAIARVEVDPDNELSAKVIGVDGSNNGSAAISCTADGDPDDDNVRTIIGTHTVTVTQGEAFVFDLTPGTPEDVPPVP